VSSGSTNRKESLMDLFRNGQQLPGTRTAADEPGRKQTSTLEIEGSFCWDHGYHLGPCCPRCRYEIEQHVPEHKDYRPGIALAEWIPKSAA
jgi:hypothetical protein